ncbi:MAG TPA: UTP--glucose-1-phosphate uridylyltransferase [Anaerolineae bacterium]|nr:UTP--glucose-1-phosphate uridylyltransferase [Anaerolineae bacterium]HQI86070.1 UTP--glucose-1-phosphate uridylyltransferase [Anaerolineae bacterium]
MSSRLIDIITASDPAVRNRSLDAFCRAASLGELLDECAALETFRRASDNLYERVRALFFLYAIHRFHLPDKLDLTGLGKPVRSALIPYDGYTHLLQRRFEEAIDCFLALQTADGPSDSISSALAEAYHRLGFQTLADQVRRSVRSVRGNQWMFRTGHPADHPLRVRRELLQRSAEGLFPVLHEATPVRMDLSHSGWSDIFFLGMDFPEGARVLNVSIDLAVHGRDPAPRPPVEAYLRVIDEPLLRLVSVDLGAVAEITNLAEVFDYARDYLGLLKAAIIAAGIIPPGMEGSGERLQDLLARLIPPFIPPSGGEMPVSLPSGGTKGGHGLELVSQVNGIPKGSRLAVSTSLLACLIAVCMRATGQTQSLTGMLQEHERRLVAARAILGEWLAGSGGGWQDSGGVWPGMKLITGQLAGPDDPEYGISRGRLLPGHHIMGADEVPAATRERLQNSLVLVHGGMAQDVGPILEMVTEKYLLRSEAEWIGRQRAMRIYDEIVDLLQRGDVRGIGDATTRNFFDPIQTIIPWANNLYTTTVIDRVRAAFGDDFWGFWMLGGMSGGGMGFIFEPGRRTEAQERLHATMLATKRELENALPFAMEPVVYDFAINERGTFAELRVDAAALMSPAYYTLMVPALLKRERYALTLARRAELDRFGAACRTDPALAGMMQTLFDRIIPRADRVDTAQSDLDALLDELGFDRIQHEQIRADLRSGRIGLAQNRLPASTVIEDVYPEDVASSELRIMNHESRIMNPESPIPNPQSLITDYQSPITDYGLQALRAGRVAVVTLAAGVGSRWTHGAGVVKALNPFCKLGGKHRSFIEVHLAKSRRVGQAVGMPIPHIITTSYLTHDPIRDFLARCDNYGYTGPLYLSPGRAVGLRLIPMARDLRFAWEEMPQQLLDEQAQKVRESLHTALIGWAQQMGESSDYRDNLPQQCLHPVGHWFEIPNLLKNGVLARLLAERPQLEVLMIHNIDTVGADVDPAILGSHLDSGAAMTIEVITRRVEDRGGGLARVDGHLRLIEGLALPQEEDEFKLSYYNSNTMWISIDKLLDLFGLTRADLSDAAKIDAAVRAVAARMPTYITLKDVKKRWGHGQEDIFPVAQFEKLWGDMTALPGLDCRYVVVPRMRGQQLKEPAQLDGWLRDGSAAYVEGLCTWE